MRVAVAGLGWWGKQIISCLEKSPRFDTRYGVDPLPSASALDFLSSLNIRHAPDLASVLADPDIDGVILATPHQLHEEQCLAVLAAGKELFCEKPLAMTAAGARRIVDACERAGKVLGIGHERRYEECFELVQELVGEGALGTLLLYEANISHDLFKNIDRSNWRLDPKHAPAGMMTATGIHQTDLCVALFGEPCEVRAETASLTFAPPASDFVTAALKFKSGARATITLLSCVPYYGRVTVFGDKGWVEVMTEGNVDQGKPTVVTQCTGTQAPRQVTVYHPTDTVTANFESWAAAVAGEKRYRFSSAELVDNIRIFEAIVRSSAEDGRTVSL
ncbi:Gfo/Idh/MocA family protein [Taklimakanibacter deserti]|uniref:Gfo/Idh/MocA family protein n=1 Tax=Taklimakanibacter deserti TaxID=2267839 RepID=UPI000E65B5FC